MKIKNLITIVPLVTLLLGFSNYSLAADATHTHGDRSHSHDHKASSHSHNKGAVSQYNNTEKQTIASIPEHTHKTKVIYVNSGYYPYSSYYRPNYYGSYFYKNKRHRSLRHKRHHRSTSHKLHRSKRFNRAKSRHSRKRH